MHLHTENQSVRSSMISERVFVAQPCLFTQMILTDLGFAQNAKEDYEKEDEDSDFFRKINDFTQLLYI